MTLAQLRALLALAHGPAVERLADRTLEGVARAYLAREIAVSQHDGPPMVPCAYAVSILGDWVADSSVALDLTDPGTVHAVKVVLALALGLDPGPMGSDCRWHHRCPGAPVWVLEATDGEVAFVRWDPRGVGEDGFDRELYAPAVATEPDAIKALALAVEHVLATS